MMCHIDVLRKRLVTTYAAASREKKAVVSRDKYMQGHRGSPSTLGTTLASSARCDPHHMVNSYQ